MKLKPYFGIVDFPNHWKVLEMMDVWLLNAPTEEHMLHVGVMTSRKVLYEEPTKWASVWPKKSEIWDILRHPVAYNCLHYADYDEAQDPVLEFSLGLAMQLVRPTDLSALQLDMIWPNPAQVMIARDFAAGIGYMPEIILQVNAPALERVGNDPERLVRELEGYWSGIDRILLDKSMGRGKPMDPQVLLPFVRAVHEGLPELGIGVAGGLSADTMHLMEPIWEEFPDVSIDAHGALRPSRDVKDPIDWSLAEKYLRAACATRAKYNK